MPTRLLVVLATLLLLGALPVRAAPELYVRNRPVKGAVAQGGDYLVPLPALDKLLTPEERARVTVADGRVLVDGQAAGEAVAGPDAVRIPLVAVARALGFEARLQKEMGILDLVPPAAREKPKPPAGMKPGREHAVARARMEQVLARYPRVTDPRQQERLDRIGRQIVAATERPWVEWEFLIVSSPQPNAATTGEGILFVTDSLLGMGLSDAELAGVVGHEIAHGIARHPFGPDDVQAEVDGLLRDMEAFRKEWYNRPRVSNPSPGWLEGEQQRYENRVAEFSKRVASLRQRLEQAEFYDQSEEEDADMDGMRYAALAGFDPTGLMSALSRLASRVPLFGQGSSQGAARIEARTHPPTSRRLEILRRVYESWRRR